jgi:uncharacterized protein (TIGR02646 family)
MIQIKKKSTMPAPNILTTKGKDEATAFCMAFDKGKALFNFESALYGHQDVKSALKVAQNEKCCFCEAKITHISYGDVEHFRPKAGWVQAGEPINKPGYYWLAYEWDNLLLSCEICNQRFKKNFFPLLDNTKRATSHIDDVSQELPVFIHPVLDDPQEFIEFKEEIPFSIDDNLRGKKTIEMLGLDREALNERRRERLGLVRDLYNLAKNIPATTPEIKAEAIKVIKKRAQEATNDDAEYAAMFRAFFEENPINF